jgi:hypothetical protein
MRGSLTIPWLCHPQQLLKQRIRFSSKFFADKGLFSMKAATLSASHSAQR